MAGEGEITCTRCRQVHMSGDPCPTDRYEEPREECVEEESEEEEFNVMGECLEFGLGDEEDDGHQVAPEEMQTILVPAADPDDMRRWPRYSLPRNPGGWQHLALYNPNLTGRSRLRGFTVENYSDYLGAVGRQEPNIADGATWGRSERVTLTVSSLQRRGSQTVLEFNSSSGNSWEIEIFNLGDSQPKWRNIIRKRLMALPIQHLRITQFKTLFLDFIVGNTHLGTRGGVATGGANWPYQTASARPRAGASGAQQTVVADPNKLAGIGVSYSALNRTWGNPSQYADSFLPESDSAMDQAFDDRGIPIFTIYHEFGHLFLNTDRCRDDYPSQEAYQADVAVKQELQANQTLFGNYLENIPYGGQSTGPMEGFAEAYRKWMQGVPLGGAQYGPQVQTLFLRLGFPTQASIRSTIAAIEGSA